MSTLSPPIKPRVATLPFSELSWERFERLAHDLLLGLPWMVPESAHRYGTQGQTQFGIDLTVQHRNGERWAFSNKRYHNKYQPSHVQEHVADTTYVADHYVILISGTASAKVRDEVKKFPKWELWDSEDLSQRVRLELCFDFARRLVDHHFGPIWRRDFLGLPAVGALISPSDYFRPFLDPTRLFHHALPLVGRQELVRQLFEFAESDNEQVFLLPGRGGIGKTRLLRELTVLFDSAHPNWAIRLVNEGVPLTLDALDELPAVPCLVIADDAHRRTDLGLLLAWFRQRSESRLVLATRPQGNDYLRSELCRAGFDTIQIRHMPPVERLSRNDVLELANHILGPGQEDLAKRLTEVTRDCPLVTVVGGRLLTERRVSPEILERDDDFRQEVLNRFQDEMLGHVSKRVPADLCRRLLEAIAALNPVPADLVTFHELLAGFLGVEPVDLTRALGELEHVGLLVRRGSLLRLTPDVLADHILHAACLTPKGAVTGFADKVFAAFAEDYTSQLLRNLAELDWRIRVTTDTEPAVLNRIWDQIRVKFRAGGNQMRSHLLEMLRDSAYFLPSQVLNLVRFAIRNPAPTDETFLGQLSFTHAAVLREVHRILPRCAGSEHCLPGCLDLLWELGRADEGPTNSNPDHPFRAITDIAEYRPTKPLWVNRAVLDAVRRWLTQPDAFNYAHTPLDALDILLAKSGIEHQSNGHHIIYRPFLLKYDEVRALRSEVLVTLAQCLDSPQLQVVLRTIRSLGAGLDGPLPYLNMTITDEVFRDWEFEQLQILDLIQNLIRRNPPPVASLAVLQEVRFHAHNGPQKAVRDQAATLLRSINQSFEFRLTRMLIPEMSRWDLFEEQGGDDPVTERDARERTLAQTVVSEFNRRYPDPATAVAELDRIIRDLQRLEPKSGAGNLIWWLLKSHPENAREFAHELIVRPRSPIADCLSVVLDCLYTSSSAEAFEVCGRALDTGVLELRRAVAHFCQWGLRTDLVVHEDEPALFDRLLCDADPLIYRSGIAALRRLALVRPQDAINTALRIEVGSDNEAATELCRLADKHWGGVPDAFSDSDLNAFVYKLEEVNRINYHLADFLQFACARVPHSILELFFRRIERREREGFRPEYHPVPFDSTRPMFQVISNTDYHRDVLRQIRDHALDKPALSQHGLTKLYRHASLNYGPTGVDVLGEWLLSGNESKLRTAVALLADAPRYLIFDSIEQIAQSLECAERFGDDCLRSVASQLHNIATLGSKSGTPGQPFPEDIQVRNRCQEVLKQLPVESVIYRFINDVLRTANRLIQEATSDGDE